MLIGKIVVVSLLCLASVVFSADHPRLLFSVNDIPKLRQRIKSDPYQSMYQELVRIVDLNSWGKSPANNDSLDQLIVMHRNAFLYVLTGDDQWAKKARQIAEQRLDDPGAIHNPRTKGLTLYMHGIYLSLAYDWCYDAPSWDAPFRERVSRAIKRQGDVIAQKGGTEQNRSPASNWQGLRWSSAGLCYLATDEPINPQDLETCFQRVCTYLSSNLGVGGSGWNSEGLGYTFYPMGNGVVPFGIAIHRRDSSKDIRQATPAARYTLWTCFAPVVRNTTGMWRPDFADDNPGTQFEGTLGFAFWMTPESLHPGLKYVYDRTVGLQGDRSFDASRFGIPASILFYPHDVVPQNPMTLPEWVGLFDDLKGNGFFTFRQSYGTSDDLAVQIFAKRRGNRGHNGPDSLSYRIYGFDGLWAVGGGRYGPTLNGQHAYHRSMNTLYPVDPDQRFSTNDEPGRVLDRQLNPDGSGWVILAGNPNNVGTQNHVRRFYVTFDPATEAQSAIIIIDSSDNGTHFQHCTIETHPIHTHNNTFTITGPTGNTLTGTVLYPEKTVLTTGQRLRGSPAGTWDQNNFLTASTQDGNIVTVLTFQKKGQSPPRVQAHGNWTGPEPFGSLTIGRKTVHLRDNRFYDH
ncbi:MAG: hypothetical protein KatS3mg104_0922 [Phycisphaerae bacterium]|nr:MAG: hypothetical protein KatS3mg104_0922 [Phycisphaerae bacterium]